MPTDRTLRKIAAIITFALLAIGVLALAFAIVLLGACHTLTILAPATGPNECRPNESTCVGADSRPNGGCCPATYACSGPFPNVGCGSEIGFCCPTESGGLEAKQRIQQRRASAPGE